MKKSSSINPSMVDSDPSPPYPNPPIVEAVFDIRTALPDDVDLERLEGFGELEKDRYPAKRKRMEHHGEFTFDRDEAASETTSRQTGFAFTSLDQKQIVQARLDGFAFSRLQPYERWESFEAEAMRLWDVFNRSPLHRGSRGLQSGTSTGFVYLIVLST